LHVVIIDTAPTIRGQVLDFTFQSTPGDHRVGMD
jgi:hypothetical protein